jgi:hypothetical protein
MVSLYWLAHLLIKESQTAPSAAQRLASQLQALELLSLVQHDAATWQLFRDRAHHTQAELAANSAQSMKSSQRFYGIGRASDVKFWFNWLAGD